MFVKLQELCLLKGYTGGNGFGLALMSTKIWEKVNFKCSR